MKRILLPVDFSPCSWAALSYALILGEQFRSDIDVLHVWEPPVEGAGGPDALGVFVATDEGQRMKEWLMSMEQARHEQTRARLETGDPVSRILELAPEYDLIVMGTHGRTGVRHLLKGSVAEQVVRQASCPVLTVRAPSEAGGPS